MSSVSGTWLTVFAGTLPYTPILLLHCVSAAAWAVPPSRFMPAVAIKTVPGTRLEGLPLRVSQVPLLCILIRDQVWPVPSRCDTQSLRFFILVTYVLLLPSRTGSSPPFRVKGLPPRHRVLPSRCLPYKRGEFVCTCLLTEIGCNLALGGSFFDSHYPRVKGLYFAL